MRPKWVKQGIVINYKQYEDMNTSENVFTTLLNKIIEYRELVEKIDIERGTSGDDDTDDDMEYYEYDPNNPMHIRSVEMWQEINNILKDNDQIFDKFMQYQDEVEDENYLELPRLKANIIKDIEKYKIMLI